MLFIRKEFGTYRFASGLSPIPRTRRKVAAAILTFSLFPPQKSQMCGRYSITSPLQALKDLFHFAEPGLDLSPSYNIAPTRAVPIVRVTGGVRRLGFVRWGLVPSWAKQVGDKPLINARAETIADKPSFRAPFRRRRCLFPADGFYEWQKQGDGPKQPFNIVANARGPFGMAGVWDDWMGADGSEMESAAIVTTTANQTLKPIHHRMPVILKPEQYDAWSSPSSQPQDLLPLLVPAEDNLLRAYPISRRVNTTANNDLDLWTDVTGSADDPPDDPQGRLF